MIARLAAGWRAALLGCAVAAALHGLLRPAPLLVDVGPGDTSLARGFRSDWERSGRESATTFRWCLDGCRLDLPVVVWGDDLSLRLRAARFLPSPAVVTLRGDDREVATWTQAPQGWRVQAIPIGPFRGPLSLQFRTSAGDDGAAMAVDWAEVQGAGLSLPRARLIPGLLCFLGVLPWLLARWGTLPIPLTFAGAFGFAALVLHLDRLGGLVALSEAGLPGLLVLGVLLWIHRAVGADDRRSWAAAVAAVVLVLAALLHPRFYYPDIDTHARFLSAIRSVPVLAWDPTPYQIRTGAWTRTIAGERVGFPYSPVFHLAAWPLAVIFGDVRAIKILAAFCLGLTLVLTHRLGARLGLSVGEGLVAQALLVTMPVVSSRLSLALFPTLMAQALELFLVASLAAGALRSVAPAFLVLTAVQLAYTASLLNASGIAALFALALALRGDRGQALRLLTALLLSSAVVVVALYSRFLPVLWSVVLPNAASVPAAAAVNPAGRWLVFYGVPYLALTMGGAWVCRRAPLPARDAVGAALASGVLLLVLRGVFPVLLRDAKEVELLAAPVALLSAACLGRLWAVSPALRLATALAALGASLWGISRGVAAYGLRVVLEGR